MNICSARLSKFPFKPAVSITPSDASPRLTGKGSPGHASSRKAAAAMIVMSVLAAGVQHLFAPEGAGAQTAGAQAGRILVNGHSVEVTASQRFVQSMGSNIGSNVTGHRSILQKSIRWVTKDKPYPRFLYVTSYDPDQLEGAGFPECSSPAANPLVARGCLEVSFQDYDGPCVGCRDSAYPKRVNLETVDFATFDAVVVSHATTQWQVDVLNRRGPDIVSYINSGGGWLQFPEEDGQSIYKRDDKHELGFLCLNAFDVYLARDPDRGRIKVGDLGRKIGFTEGDLYQEGPLEGGAQRIAAGGAEEMVVEQAHNDAHTIGSLFKPNAIMDYQTVSFLAEEWSYAHVRGLRPAVGKDLADSGPLPVCGVNDTAAGEETAETTPATFLLTVPSGHHPDLKFRYSTRDGTALAGRDYRATSGEVVFKGQQGRWTSSFRPGLGQRRITYREPQKPGEYQATITVPILKDSEVEPEEDFFLDVTFINDQPDCFANDESWNKCHYTFDTDHSDLNPWDDHYPSVWGTCEDHNWSNANDCTPYIQPGKSFYLPKLTGVGKIVDGVRVAAPDEIRRVPDVQIEDFIPQPKQIVDDIVDPGGLEPHDRSISLAQGATQPLQQTAPPATPAGPAPSAPQPAGHAQSAPSLAVQANAQANLASSPQVQAQAQLQIAPMMQKQRMIELEMAENKVGRGKGPAGGLQASGLPGMAGYGLAVLMLSAAFSLAVGCGRPKPQRGCQLRLSPAAEPRARVRSPGTARRRRR